MQNFRRHLLYKKFAVYKSSSLESKSLCGSRFMLMCGDVDPSKKKKKRVGMLRKGA